MGTEKPLGQMIIELGLDSASFSRGMKGINQQIKTSMTEMTAHLKVMGKSGSEIDRLKIRQDGLTAALSAQNAKVSLAKEKYEACRDAVEGNTQATQQQKDALIKAQNEYVKAIGDLGQYGNELKEVTIRLDAMESGIYQAGEAMDHFGGKLSGIGQSVSAVGKSLALGVTAPIIALGTYAVKTTSEFDSAMSQVAAVSGATGEELEKLREKAREMGETTKFSASEAAEAMNYMAMAGWKTNDMLAGIEGIMDLAAASGESLATTSDIVTDALTGFGKGAEDSGRLADIMAAASSNANTNVALMGETFKYCTPIAGALGFSMEDTAEAIGLMANSGVKASMAGTSMRSMMNNLAGEVKFTGEQFGEMVIRTQESDGSMRGLNGILADCREAFSQMTDAEQVANAEALVGKNAMSGFLAVMNAAPKDIEKLNSAIGDCDGTAKDMAETMQDNLQGQITILKSQTDELAISFGGIMMPKIREIVSGVQGTVDALNRMDDGTKRTIVNIGLFAATAGPAVLVVGKLTSGIGNMVSSAGKGMQSFALWAARITNTTTAMTSQTAATVAGTAAVEAGTAASARNTAGLLMRTARTIADTAAIKVHNAAEKARNITVAAGNGTLTAQAAALNASIITRTKDTIALAANTAAEKARSIAAGASTTGITIQTVAISAQTVATNACTVATGFLSAAFKLLTGPVGWIAAGISALVAGVIAAVRWFTKETEASRKMKEETEELAEANDTLAESLSSSQAMYEDNVKTIQAQSGAAETLADKVTELSKAENKSSKQKKELQAYVRMLNESMEGLNLQYDEQADALSMNTDEINAQIEAMEKQAEGQAAAERMVEILKEQNRVQENLSQVQERIATASEDENLRNKEKRDIMADLTAQEESLNGQLDILAESFEHVSRTVEESTQAAASAASENTVTILEAYGSIKAAYDDLGEHQKQSIDGITAAYETMTGRLADLTEKIKLDDGTTWAQIQKNQADTIGKTQEFADLYSQLMEAGVSESYLKAIGATGPQSIPLLKDMMSQGVDTILESQSEWQEAYGAIGDTLTESLELDDTVKSALKDYVVGEAGIYGTLQAAVDSADLNALGGDITAGLSKGILESTDNVTGAATDMAGMTTDAAGAAWEINSPSRVFLRMGQYLMDGLVEGMSRNEGKVYAKTKAVADNVTSTLKAALEIHSPSAVMRDEIGRNIALGIAEGIEQNKDHVKKSVEDIAGAILQEAKKRLDNTKVYQELTLADEAAYWDSVRAQVKEGTQARIDADKEYFEAKKAINLKMGNIETDYTSKVRKAYSDLESGISSLQESYKDELVSRTKDIMSSMGLFDEFSAKTELSTSDLIRNLRSQVDGLSEWTNNLDVLRKRGIGDGLVETLREMGTGAAGEVALMTQMTDEELDEYVGLFQSKQRIAGSEAAEELEPMLAETRKKMYEMRMDAAEELEKYKEEFVNAMTEIGVEIQTPLDQINQALLGAMSTAVQSAAGTMSEEAGNEDNTNKFGEVASQVLQATQGLPEEFNTLGQNTIEGLIQGLKSKSGELYEAMTGIIQSAIQAVKDEAQIHSPSRVMMSMGSYMLQGFGIGMEHMQGYIEDVAGVSAKNVSQIFQSNLEMGQMELLGSRSALSSETGVIAAIGHALKSLTGMRPAEEMREEQGGLQELIGNLASSNAQMIKLLQVIANKNPVIDRKAITNVIDTGLEEIKALRVRGV